MMNKERNRLGRYAKWAVIVVVGMLANAAYASCSYRAENPYGSGPADLVAPLNINSLTVGRDVRNGTVLYRQTVRTMTTLIRCENIGGTATLQDSYWLTATPLKLSSWNGSPFPGQVYETGVPGIGVALWYSGNAFPYRHSFTNCGGVGVACNWNGTQSMFDISLIKIGPVTPGVIHGANLPSMQYDRGSDKALPIMKTRFTGSIQIVAQTCTTPDVNVPLGNYKVSDFSGAGSGTPFKDFAIELQNCPAFYGASASMINSDSATGWQQSGLSVTPNVLRFSLTAVNGTVAAQRGTVQLSPGTPGAPAATGIGVQLFRTLGGFLSFDTQLPTGITPESTPGGGYSIPMQARYVQIGAERPTPGPANASVMFTINYQ
ncbi:fimbrial protein [Achromobacter xylosoxidans]